MIRLHALGQNLVVIGETRLTPTSGTLFGLAVYLVLDAGRPVERERLVELFWPGATEERAYHRLRQTLYRLNAAGASLRSDRAHIVLPSRSAQSDCAMVLEAVQGASAERAAERVHGAFLPGYVPRISVAFGDWLEHQRGVMHAALRRVLVAGINAKKARGEWAGAERLAARCLAIDPLNEEATLALAEPRPSRGAGRGRSRSWTSTSARSGRACPTSAAARRHSGGASPRLTGASESQCARCRKWVVRRRWRNCRARWSRARRRGGVPISSGVSQGSRKKDTLPDVVVRRISIETPNAIRARERRRA